MPRVVFLDQRADIAGAQVVLLELLRVAVDAGWDVTLAIPLGGALEDRVRQQFGGRVAIHALDVPRVSSGRKSPVDLWRLGASAVAMRLPEVVRTADLVHVNGPRLYPAWWWANRRLQIPSLYHVHLAHAPLERWFIRSALLRDRAARVIANSPYVWRELGGAESERLVLVENALPRGFAGLAFEDRWTGGPLRVAVVGALIPEKGHGLVLEAARGLAQVEFHLAGGATEAQREYASELRRRATANVHFYDHVADVRAWVTAVGAQCAVVPSVRGESFGLAAVECMASSCLTLVSARGALPDIATVTGARVFSDGGTLIAMLREIGERDSASGREEARQQHERVNAHYAPARFEREMRACFDAALTRE